MTKRKVHQWHDLFIAKCIDFGNAHLHNHRVKVAWAQVIDRLKPRPVL